MFLHSTYQPFSNQNCQPPVILVSSELVLGIPTPESFESNVMACNSDRCCGDEKNVPPPEDIEPSSDTCTFTLDIDQRGIVSSKFQMECFKVHRLFFLDAHGRHNLPFFDSSNKKFIILSLLRVTPTNQLTKPSLTKSKHLKFHELLIKNGNKKDSNCRCRWAGKIPH